MFERGFYHFILIHPFSVSVPVSVLSDLHGTSDG